MNQKYFVGVDISKNKIDCAVMDAHHRLLTEKELRNSDTTVKIFLASLLKKLKIQVEDLLVCCENTGIYNRPLERVCTGLGVSLWVEHPLKIKRASTDMRGKDDRKDAIRIAEYALRYQDRKVIFTEPSEIVAELNAQVKVRESLLAQKVALENQLREASSHDPDLFRTLKAGYKAILRTLTSSIKSVEVKIEELSLKDQKIAENVALIQSIPGVGLQTALSLIIATDNFRSFTSAKHLACYAGVVPFKNQSGTIIKRERVSRLANMKIKKLLHLAAMAACRSDQGLKAFYIRKVQDGKNKMSVLNAIRNKLVHRIMAVVLRKTPYLKNEQDFYQNRNLSSCILT
jgi:transposase